MKLTIEKAEVKIKVMRIGRRQVTKIIFRQIPEANPYWIEDCGDVTFKEDFQTWGFVDVVLVSNDYEYNGDYWWMLWSFNGEVFRTRVQDWLLNLCDEAGQLLSIGSSVESKEGLHPMSVRRVFTSMKSSKKGGDDGRRWLGWWIVCGN